MLREVKMWEYLCALLLIVSLTGCVVPIEQSAGTQNMMVAPDAGEWGTWVLSSSDELRPDAPPDAEASLAEIATLKELVAQNDDAAAVAVTYWNTGSPTYRWVQITTDRHATLPPGPPNGRGMSLVTVAMYDALVAAWDAKYTYNRMRPSQVDGSVAVMGDLPNSPSYPSERAVVAGAASAVLGYLVPDEAEQFAAQAEEAAQSQLLAGTHYPSDVEAGLALGRAVAAKVIERAQNDGSDVAWEGEVPTGPGLWVKGEKMFMPTAGTWRTWLLESNDQLRPGPPPAFDSPELAAELAAIKDFERTLATNASAFYWQSAVGNKAHWFEAAHQLIFENQFDQNPPLAALVYSTVGVGIHDAFIACFDAKYTYWMIRPSQVDPEITTVFGVPPHPSYPSAHGCNSGAGAATLAGFFPADYADLMKQGQEGADSRLWAGIHYPSDNQIGLEMGVMAGEMAVEQAMEMMNR